MVKWRFRPDGKWLAYSHCARRFVCDIYLQELDADYKTVQLPRQVTRQGLDIAGISWAADSLVYGGSMDWGMRYHLWRVDPGGKSEPERLELAGVYANYPAVSGTANRLAYLRCAPQPQYLALPAGKPACFLYCIHRE